MEAGKYIRLAGKIIRDGRLPAKGPDFTERRREALEPLHAFCPPSFTPPAPKRRPSLLRGQIAYVLSALKSRPGHLCVPERKLCYIRIPRAGSTALSKAILHTRYPELKSQQLTFEVINFLADANLQRVVDGQLFFTVVRNPFSRIVSFYRAFFERSGDNFIYEDYLFGIFKRNMSFKKFIETAEIVPDRLKDQHFRPQHLFLSPYQRRASQVRVFRLEDPSQLNSFCASYGLSIERINADDRHYDYRNYYDESILERVYGMYARDVGLGGYKSEYEHLLAWTRSNASSQSRSH